MKLLRLSFVVLVCLCCCLSSRGQDKMGKISFIRSTNYVGSLINFGFYIDDKMVCKLKNNHYSVHDVPAGAHKVVVQNRGYGRHTKSKPLTINVKEGEVTYLSVGAGSSLYLQEITQSSAEELLKNLVLNKDCLGKEKVD